MKLTEFHQKVFESSSTSKGPGGVASASAVRHINRSWALIEEMPEIAVFLAICAEEESATAVFHSLRGRKYNRSKELNHRSHIHKHGLYPFLCALGSVLIPDPDALKLELYFDTEMEPKHKEILRTRIVLETTETESYYLTPNFPVDIVAVGSDGKPEDYSGRLKEVASVNGVDLMFDHIRNLANERNKVLYASQGNISVVENPEEIVRAKTSTVIWHLITYLLIEPYKVQHLPQQALYAFLNMLNRVETSDEILQK